MNQKEIEQLAEKISIDRSVIDNERILKDAEAALDASKSPATSHVREPLHSKFRLLICAGSLAAALLIISSLVVCFILSGKVADLKNVIDLLGWDQQTYMPPGGAVNRGYQLATLAKIMHIKFTDPEVGEILE